MVENWKTVFELKELPFYFVQIAPYWYNNQSDILSGKLYDEQYKSSLIVPNAGMAATVDLGEEFCIHPAEKKIVGERLSYCALSETYGVKGIAYKNPNFKSIAIKDSAAIISFDNIAIGLTSYGKEISNVEIAGDNQPFTFHLHNIVLHLINTALVYLFCIYLVYSPWSTVDGPQSMVHSPWSIVDSQQSTVDGQQSTVRFRQSMIEGQESSPDISSKFPKQKSEDITTVDRGPSTVDSSVDCRPSTADYITITITDNGVGRVFTREYNRNNPASTGKGLHIMEDYYALFEKLYNIRITADFEDLYTDSGEAAGTRVRVRVPVRKGLEK
jgi:hypothetical protein